MGLRQNCLTSFEPKQQLTRLEILNLENNNLTKIPALQGKNTSLGFLGLTKMLYQLILSGNNITEINEEFILNFEARNTFALYLNDNPIEQLPNLYKYTGSKDTKINIFLRGIRFLCNNLCWMSRVG